MQQARLIQSLAQSYIGIRGAEASMPRHQVDGNRPSTAVSTASVIDGTSSAAAYHGVTENDSARLVAPDHAPT